jgi:hypothetical protein
VKALGTGAAILVGALACQGCAEIRVRTTPQILGETLGEPRRETVVGAEVLTQVEQTGSRIEIVASRICADHAMHDVTRKTRRTFYDANARGTRGLGIAGGVIAAAGGFLMALPAMPVQTDHPTDLGFGIPFAILGVTLAAVALSGVLRASATIDEVNMDSVDSGVVDPNVPCGHLRHALVDEPVTGKVAGWQTVAVALGKTDDHGRLAIDLATIPISAVREAPEPKTMTLFIRGTAAGEVSLAEVARVVEEEVWSRLDLAGCAAPARQGACQSVEQFVHDFPEGRHVADARDVLDRGAVVLRKLAAAAALEQAALAQKLARERAVEARKTEAVDAAAAAARHAAAATCRQTCKSICSGGADCAAACVQRTCVE